MRGRTLLRLYFVLFGPSPITAPIAALLILIDAKSFSALARDIWNNGSISTLFSMSLANAPQSVVHRVLSLDAFSKALSYFSLPSDLHYPEMPKADISVSVREGMLRSVSGQLHLVTMIETNRFLLVPLYAQCQH